MYILDAVTGVIVNKRQVRRKLFLGFIPGPAGWLKPSAAAPFNGTDLPCTDIQGTVGITGTPLIKRSTNTLYFFAKGYRGGVGGFANGAYVLDSRRGVAV